MTVAKYDDPGDQNVHPQRDAPPPRCPDTIDLFASGSSRANARNSDPDTSHAAAESISSERIRRSQAAVLSCLKQQGPRHDTLLISDYEAQRAERQWPEQSPSGIRTRRSELVDRGFVADSGGRQRLASGRMAIVWVAI